MGNKFKCASLLCWHKYRTFIKLWSRIVCILGSQILNSTCVYVSCRDKHLDLVAYKVTNVLLIGNLQLRSKLSKWIFLMRTIWDPVAILFLFGRCNSGCYFFLSTPQFLTTLRMSSQDLHLNQFWETEAAVWLTELWFCKILNTCFFECTFCPVLMFVICYLIVSSFPCNTKGGSWMPDYLVSLFLTTRLSCVFLLLSLVCPSPSFVDQCPLSSCVVWIVLHHLLFPILSSLFFHFKMLLMIFLYQLVVLI